MGFIFMFSSIIKSSLRSVLQTGTSLTDVSVSAILVVSCFLSELSFSSSAGGPVAAASFASIVTGASVPSFPPSTATVFSSMLATDSSVKVLF